MHAATLWYPTPGCPTPSQCNTCINLLEYVRLEGRDATCQPGMRVQVESAPCRAAAGPLTYVVAFANSGAKDVTQRYVSSFMATEKLRCGAWWDATLAPLRRLQLAGV